MNEQRVLDIIRSSFRSLYLTPPEGIDPTAGENRRRADAWRLAARRIVDECEHEKHAAARAASLAGYAITRGRTRL